MANKGYEFQSEFARHHEAIGVVKGEAIGVVKGEATALVAVLRSRGLVVSEAHRDRITACTDPATLERWIERAVVAMRVDDIFD